MTEQKHRASRLLPYPVIVAAASGDVEAMGVVLKHYEGYISRFIHQAALRRKRMPASVRGRRT